ncbi:GAF domain-containing protein [Leptolyngbya sp. Cla-17]|uniref:GAF domain-containing sensor histidine kinase n=1 Tax=Leptolyngbya sp. Cla-17 TaxID=2803751 RepID=UPI001F5DCF7F|nr:GAF domain-containing protein [Leptolyngbya sp. Cla-17]
MKPQQGNWLSPAAFLEPQGVIENLQLSAETARLNALYQYGVIDKPPAPSLDELTALAAEICEVPIALISLVDADRQWFKSRVGVAITETPRSVAFCAHAIQQAEVFIVKDALADERFAHNPLVTQDPKIRFYAGMPLLTPEGFALGTLCVIDYEPRDLSQKQLRRLETLSHQVMAQLELERQTLKLQQTKIEIQQLKQQFVEQEFFSQQELILLNLANQLRNSLDLNTILQTAVDEIRKLLHVDRCHFLWCISDGDHLISTMTHEAKTPALPSLLDDFSGQYGAFLTTTISNQTREQIDNVLTTTALAPEAQVELMRLGITSALLLPLKTQSGQLGAVVCSDGHGPRTWTDREVNLLQTVTEQLAIALDQAELLSRSRATALAAQTQAEYLVEAMRKLQQTQAQLIQHEKMSSLGQLVAGVAHEINNPVNFISGNITYISGYIRDLMELLKLYQEYYPTPESSIQAKANEIDFQFLVEDLPKLLASMEMGSDRIRQIVLSLRNFSRLDEADVKPVNIHEGLGNTLLILQSRLKATSKGRPIRINRVYSELPAVECYAGQLNQVFMNILSNAIDAVDDCADPMITIQTEVIHCPDFDASNEEQITCTPQVAIHIRDNGTGISDDTKQKLFNPFFTTKPVGKGTGLGLSISYQIVVEKHRGSLSCSSAIGQGTEFLLQIPIQLPTTPTK